MSVEKELKKLQTTEMMHCDGCGGYHPIADCEVVVIRMIKGKDCELATSMINQNSFNVSKKAAGSFYRKMTESNDIEPTHLLVDDELKETIHSITPTAKTIGNMVQLPSGEVADPDGIGRRIPPAEMEQINKNKKNIIPPEFRGMTVSPASPNFESTGNKFIRPT